MRNGLFAPLAAIVLALGGCGKARGDGFVGRWALDEEGTVASLIRGYEADRERATGEERAAIDRLLLPGAPERVRRALKPVTLDVRADGTFDATILGRSSRGTWKADGETLLLDPSEGAPSDRYRFRREPDGRLVETGESGVVLLRR